jgi:hypothetical protein
MKGRFYKPAAWANLSVPVLAVHWVRVPCLPNPSARASPARDGFEKFPRIKPQGKTGALRQKWLKTPVRKRLCTLFFIRKRYLPENSQVFSSVLEDYPVECVLCIAASLDLYPAKL